MCALETKKCLVNGSRKGGRELEEEVGVRPIDAVKEVEVGKAEGASVESIWYTKTKNCQRWLL
jgi:hypothetical protein